MGSVAFLQPGNALALSLPGTCDHVGLVASGTHSSRWHELQNHSLSPSWPALTPYTYISSVHGQVAIAPKAVWAPHTDSRREPEMGCSWKYPKLVRCWAGLYLNTEQKLWTLALALA